MFTGKRVFKRGQNLRSGLIDVNGVMSVINNNNNQDTIGKQNQNQRGDMVLVKNKSSRSFKSEKVVNNEKRKWQQALKAMSKDPKLLFDALPTITDQI